MPSKPTTETENGLRLQAQRKKKMLEIERIEYEKFLKSENIRLEKELKKIKLEKIKLEKKTFKNPKNKQNKCNP